MCDQCGASLSLTQAAPVQTPPTASSGGAVRSGSGGGVQAPGATRHCLSCNAAVPDGNRFCGACGSPMPEETRPSAPMPQIPVPQGGGGGNGKKTLFFSSMQAARAKLVLIKGDGLDGVSFALAGSEHIAGSGEVDLPFDDDPYMCPEHANFVYDNGQLVVRDISDVNGIYIRIRGSHPLQFGDRFLVGEQVIEVQETLQNLDLVPDSTQTYFYASPRSPSQFRVIQLLRGGGTGLALRASNDTVSLGREGNDLNFPDDPFISGRHAQVVSEDGSLKLMDLGSKNGTFVRVNSEAVLQHGDYVFMGQQLLRVEIV